MAKRYTFSHLILLALFVAPCLLRANGNPTGNPLNGEPGGNTDSLATRLGHCDPIIVVVPDCTTHTIELSAWVKFPFSGQMFPLAVNWSTGQMAHKITVVPPGAWSWDASATGFGCEEYHWENEFKALGPFFDGPLEIYGPSAMCTGDNYELNVFNPGGSVFQNILWTPEGGTSLPLPITEPGNYTLLLEDEFGCPFTDQFEVNANPPAMPALLAPQAICLEGHTAFIQVNPTFTHYLWENGDTLNPHMINAPGTYNVTVTNQFGCIGTQEITVNLSEVPPVEITMSIPGICSGQFEVLTAALGYKKYQWSDGDITISNTVSTPGTYVVTVTNFYGCTGTGSITVDTLPTPTIEITSTPFCLGGSSELTVTSDFPQYLWSMGQTDNPITVTTSGTYTVTVSGEGFCSTTQTVSVAQLQSPKTLIAPPAQLNCALPQTNLNAVGSSADSNFTFVWSTAGGNFVSGQNTLTPTVNAAGTYTLAITNIVTGCTSSATVAVTSNMQPPPAPVGNPATLPCSVTDLNIGPASPPVDTTLVPSWAASGGGNIVSGQNSWNPNVNQPGTYTLTVTNPANHCTATGSVVINQNTALPSSVIVQPKQITCTTNTVALDGSGSSSGSNFTYLWMAASGGTISGATNTASATAASIGTYTLLVTNTVNGCTAVSSVVVTADLNIPTATALLPATLTCNIQSIVIDATASSSGPTFTYTWMGSPGSITAGQGTLTPTVNAPGTYVLELVNNANSCSATFSLVVPQDVVPPTANAGPNSTLNCVIPSLQLDGTTSSTGPNFMYQWTSSNGAIVSGATGLTPTVSMAGTYNLLIVNMNNGCTANASVQVLNDANAPIANIANPTTLTCTTLQTIINGSGSTQNANYTYTWSGPGIIAGQGTLQPTVNLPGTYTLDIVNTVNSCIDTESVNVPEDFLPPVAQAGPDGLINCTGPAGIIGSASNSIGLNFTLLWTTVSGNFTSPTNAPTATINAAGTYQLLITNNTNGCTDTDDVIITDDFVPPAVDSGPTFQLNCAQTATVLQGTGSVGPNFTYLWTTLADGNIVSGANTLSPTVNASGTYNLLVTNTTNGCKSNDQVVITQNAVVPNAVIAAPNTLTCIVTSLNLYANGTSVSPTITYSWTASNGGNISLGGTTLTPTIDAPGTYTLLTADAANGCTSTAVVVVPENIVNPVVDAGNPNTLNCVVTTLPLEATIVSSSSPGISYVWSTANGTILGGGNTATPSIGAPGLYAVTVTDAVNGCTGTDNVQIVADVIPPTALIAQPATLTCALLQTPIDATGSSPAPGFTYQWTTTNGHIVSGGNTNQPLVDDPGTYNLLITSTTNGCTQTASTTVAEDVAKPVAAAGPMVGLDCDTQTNSLDGSASSQGANFSYLWSTGNGQIVSGGATLAPQIGDPGTYTLTVNNLQNGCFKTDVVVVTEDLTTPAFVIAPPQLLTCVTTSTLLDGSGSNFGIAPTYTWTTTNGNIVSGANTLDAVANEPGTYTLTVLNNQTGCTDTEQVTVSENVNQPVVNALPVSPLTCSVLERTLTANAPSQALLQWSASNGGHIVSGANSPNPVVDEPGLYTVTATLPLNGCTATTQTSLLREMNVPTGLQFSLDPPLCNGTLGLLTVDQINGGIGPFEYSIDGGNTFFPAQDIDGLEPGTYDLVIRDVNGCEITQNVPVLTPLTPTVDLPPSFSIVLGNDQQLQAIVPPAFPLALINQVIWEPLTALTFAGTTVSQMLSPVAMPFVTTEYKVTILTKEGCKAESRTIIKVDRDIDIYAPNVIWPSDPDSDNSVFTLFTRPGSVEEILSLQVYDRWGEQLFVNKNFLPDDLSLGWQGDFKGEPVNPGVFVWWAEVELIDGQKVRLKGDVTVVR